jgi:hypothetical protein
VGLEGPGLFGLGAELVLPLLGSGPDFLLASLEIGHQCRFSALCNETFVRMTCIANVVSLLQLLQQLSDVLASMRGSFSVQVTASPSQPEWLTSGLLRDQRRIGVLPC